MIEKSVKRRHAGVAVILKVQDRDYVFADQINKLLKYNTHLI